jgi:LEA14-like dessication related protein
MKTSSINIILLISIIAVFSSCGIIDQSRAMRNFGECSFWLMDVQDVTLAGVDLQYVDQFSDLSFSETARITAAVLSGDLPLSFTLNVEVYNPNQEKALMNELKWILFIDDKEITKGIVDRRIEVSPNGGTALLPITLSIDLFDALSGESADAIINFGFKLAGHGGEPSRIKLKAKPSVYVSGRKINYPGYITVEGEL